MRLTKNKSMILILLLLAGGSIVIWWVAQSTDKQMRIGLLQQTRIAAQAISVDYLSSLSASEKDLETPAYQHIKKQLASMRSARDNAKFLYLMGKSPDGRVFFFADSLQPESEDYAPPGLIYDEVPDSYLPAFDIRQEAVVGPITDRWGTLITALVPIATSDPDRLVAVLGMDVKANDWNQEIIRRCVGPFLVILLILLLIFLLTSRENILAELKGNEEQLRNIFENTTNLFYSHTADHQITYLSPQVEHILGYTVEEAMIKWTEFASDDPINEIGFQNTIKAIETGERQPTYELELIRKDGKKIIVEARESPIVKNGKTVAMVGSLTDITERKLAEKEKLKAQKIAGEQKKLALVGQVAGKMAHDFNNILGIIMGNTELAIMDCKDEETKTTLELIFKQTIRGKNLTKNLVAFAKDQEPKQEFFRISEKIDLVLNLMRKELEGIELRKEESQDVPELLADPGMIEHALVNLIQNSIHATSMNEFPRIIVRTYSLDNKICLEIGDNGCGISKENLENIYEPSFTLKGSRDVTGSYKSGIKGTGYGMANVKKYVEQHKGSISIESEVGVGATFTICLPIIKKELTTKEKAELKKEMTQFEKYILLVEDETAISDVQYRILTSEPCNHKVDVAHNGQMAKDLFERNTYDFVSLDYVLPRGINGMDFYHHIRKTNKTVPVLFISGNIEFLESIKELKQKDAYIDHLSKPCQNKDYVNVINELLEKPLAEQ